MFLNRGGDIVSMSVKLRESHLEACQLPFCTPTHYGMGKHGWVTCRFSEGMDVPVELLQDWIDVSFRTVAPKTLVKSLPESGPPASSPKPPPAARTDHRVVILGHDDLRIARAAAEFGARCEANGRSMADDDALDGLQELDLLVIDLGRQESDGLELAGMLAGTRPSGLKLILAGLRDARAEVRAREAVPEASFFSRDPPGDPTFVSKALLV